MSLGDIETRVRYSDLLETPLTCQNSPNFPTKFPATYQKLLSLWELRAMQRFPQKFSDSSKRHLTRRHLSVSISDGGCTQNALSLKQHLFPHGSSVKIRAHGFLDLFFIAAPFSWILFHFSSSTLKRHLLGVVCPTFLSVTKSCVFWLVWPG